MLPKTTKWGRKTDFENQECILCDLKENKPFLIWIIRCVSGTWFIKKGKFAEKLNITIIPMDISDATLTTDWVAWLACPPHGLCLCLSF